MNMKTVAFILLVALLAGCGEEEKAEVTRSVDWYKEHNAEREAKLTECKNNPGELAVTPNCINAQKAASAKTWGARGKTKLVPLTAEQLKQKQRK